MPRDVFLWLVRIFIGKMIQAIARSKLLRRSAFVITNGLMLSSVGVSGFIKQTNRSHYFWTTTFTRISRCCISCGRAQTNHANVLYLINLGNEKRFLSWRIGKANIVRPQSVSLFICNWINNIWWFLLFTKSFCLFDEGCINQIPILHTLWCFSRMYK